MKISYAMEKKLINYKKYMTNKKFGDFNPIIVQLKSTE